MRVPGISLVTWNELLATSPSPKCRLPEEKYLYLTPKSKFGLTAD
jgi:hypothetical protein